MPQAGAGLTRQAYGKACKPTVPQRTRFHGLSRGAKLKPLTNHSSYRGGLLLGAIRERVLVPNGGECIKLPIRGKIQVNVHAGAERVNKRAKAQVIGNKDRLALMAIDTGIRVTAMKVNRADRRTSRLLVVRD